MKTIDSLRPTRYAGRHMRFLSLTLAAVLACIAGAAAQSSASGGTVSTLGVITPGHCASFATPTSIQDAGTCGTGTGNVATSGTITSGQIALWASGTAIKSVAVSGDSTLSSTGVMENVGLLNNTLPSLTTGALNWTGSAWAFSAFGNLSGSGITTPVAGQPVYPNGTANTLAPSTAYVDAWTGGCSTGYTTSTDIGLCINALTTKYLKGTIDLRGLPSGAYLNSPMATPQGYLLTAAASGTGVYTGTFPAATNQLAGYSITITGFGNSANNGTFTISASTAATITTSNSASVAQSGQPGLGTLPNASVFTGKILLGNTTYFINNVTGLQTFGPGVQIEGLGKPANGTGTSTDSTSIPYLDGTGTDFELCSTHDTLVADYLTSCASTSYTAALTADGNNYPAVITMSGYLASAGAVGSLGINPYAVRVTGIAVGCGMLADAVAVANYSAQELSKFDNIAIHDCSSTANIGIALGGGLGGAENMWITDVQISTLAGKTNVASATGVQIWTGTGNGLPTVIERLSIVNNSTTGTLPNHCITYAGGTTNIGEMVLLGGHLESCGKDGIAEGVATINGTDTGEAANGLLIIDFNCGPGFGSGALSACVRLYSSTNLTGAAVTNAQILGSSATCVGSAPINLIGDDNNTVIPCATKFVVRYETSGTSAVISDTSGTNVTRVNGVPTPLLCAGGGTGTAMTCTTTASWTPSAGDSFILRTTIGSTGALTLAVNGGSAITVLYGGGSTAIANGTLLISKNYLINYDGTNYIVEGQTATIPGALVTGNLTSTVNVQASGLMAAGTTVSAGTGFIDKSIGVTTAAMTNQTTATCTNITGMTWNIAASKNYRLECRIPRTLATTATLQYCLGGPGTPTSYTLDVQGANGTAGVWADTGIFAQTAYGNKSVASVAAADTAVDTVTAQIQNGTTASGTALTLQTAANGTNAITVLANAVCTLTQEN